jgi:hypothetical protein
MALAPATAGAQSPPPLDVPAGKTLVVIGQEDRAAMDDYVAGIGRPPAGFMHYAHLDKPGPEFAAELGAIAAHSVRYPGTALQIGLTMGPSPVWSTLGGEPQPGGAGQITRGEFDAQIDALARWLNGLGDTPVFLRVGYEFDLLGGQWGTPPEYRAAYRYIVDRLRARGVDNAAYVWHSSGAFFRALDYSGSAGLVGTMDRSGGKLDPAVEGLVNLHKSSAAAAGIEPDLQPIGRFYPGDGYVDYFAVSYFGDACCFGQSSTRAREVYHQRTRELLAEARRMGLRSMIGEATPAYIGFDSAEGLTYLRKHFELVEEFDLAATAMIVLDWEKDPFWGASYWNGFWPDARVHRHRAAREAWLAELAKPRYVQGPP